MQGLCGGPANRRCCLPASALDGRVAIAFSPWWTESFIAMASGRLGCIAVFAQGILFETFFLRGRGLGGKSIGSKIAIQKELLVIKNNNNNNLQRCQKRKSDKQKARKKETIKQRGKEVHLCLVVAIGK